MATRWAVKASYEEAIGVAAACGNVLGYWYYTELSTVPLGISSDFHALGGLPCFYQLAINNPANGRTTYQTKQDIGSGSPGFLPVMGISGGVMQDLGLSGGEFDLIISAADDSVLHPVRGNPVGAGPGSGGPAVTATPISEQDYESGTLIRAATYELGVAGAEVQDFSRYIDGLMRSVSYCDLSGRR